MRTPVARVFLLSIVLAALGTTLLTASASAQVDQDHAVWAGATATQELNRGDHPVALWLDVHRRQDTTATAMIVRPGIGVFVNSWLSLWAGYAWTPVYPDDAARRDEHRFWYQAWINTPIGGGFAFQARGRMEHRFSPLGDDVAHRFRQFVRLGWMHATQPVGFVVWDELFLGFAGSDWGAVEGYDQNRFFVGPVFKIASWARVEPGYLVVHLDREPYRLVHAVAVNLFFSGTR